MATRSHLQPQPLRSPSRPHRWAACLLMALLSLALPTIAAPAFAGAPGPARSGPLAALQDTPYPISTNTNTPDPYLNPGSASPTGTPASTNAAGATSPTVTPFATLAVTPSPTGNSTQPAAPAASFPGDATATLLPFPTVTVEFPVIKATAVLPGISRPPGDPGLVKPASPPGLVRLWPLGLILLIWMLLGAWYYFTLRSFQI